MQFAHITSQDVLKIEREARKLRAEAMAHGVKAMFSWVKSFFDPRAYRGHRAA